MRSWERLIFYKTRDPIFLWAGVISILGLGLMGAVVANQFHDQSAASVRPFTDLPDVPPIGFDSNAPLLHLERAITSEPVDMPLLMDLVAQCFEGPHDADPGAIRVLLPGAELDGSNRRVLMALLTSLVRDGDRPTGDLLSLTVEDPPIRYANFAAGVYWQHRGRIERSIGAFEREAAFAGADSARGRVVTLCLYAGDFATLDRLLNDPRYAAQFDDGRRLEIAVQRHDWLDVLRLIPTTEYDNVQVGLVALACLAGLIWLVFCVQASQPRSAFGATAALCIAAVGLGVLSITPTLLAGYWQEQVMGLVPRDDLAGGLLFFLAGVGLREELVKLLFVTPLLPILLRRGNELEMLIVAGCVGLGFAAEENIQYYHSYGAIAAPSRFLTANFFHIAATGLCGLALCRAIRNPREGVNQFLSVFLFVVVVHALYDALISLPDLAEASFISLVCFIVLCWQFFREMRERRGAKQDAASLTATFLFGLSFLVAVTLVYMAHDIGLAPAVRFLGPAAAELGIIAYVILRELPGTMVTV